MKEGFLRAEDGYTLLETVVSLALFLGVLIPTGAVIGNMFLDNRSELLQRSLYECESEMTRVITENDFANGDKQIDSHLTIQREITISGEFVEIEIAAISSKRSIVSLHKSLLTAK